MFSDISFRMGCGGKEVTLEVFESYLKKLLHMIDKLPNLDREKAVMILKNSANHYYDLTLGQSLHVANVAAAAEYFNTPAQVQCKVTTKIKNIFVTFNLD